MPRFYLRSIANWKTNMQSRPNNQINCFGSNSNNTLKMVLQKCRCRKVCSQRNRRVVSLSYRCRCHVAVVSLSCRCRCRVAGAVPIQISLGPTLRYHSDTTATSLGPPCESGTIKIKISTNTRKSQLHAKCYLLFTFLRRSFLFSLSNCGWTNLYAQAMSNRINNFKTRIKEKRLLLVIRLLHYLKLIFYYIWILMLRTQCLSS